METAKSAAEKKKKVEEKNQPTSYYRGLMWTQLTTHTLDLGPTREQYITPSTKWKNSTGSKTCPKIPERTQAKKDTERRSARIGVMRKHYETLRNTMELYETLKSGPKPTTRSG